MRVLLVAKRPLLERLTSEEAGRRGQALADLRTAAAAHNSALTVVQNALADCDVRHRTLDEVQPHDADDRDLVVTVGGDGTALVTSVLHATRPVITVNSDPDRSVGHFARCTAETFAPLLAAFRAGHHRLEYLPRLEVRIDHGDPHRFLNDCLFTCRHPALVTRYVLTVDGTSETQVSSGVWVSTASGSTGAIRSAGMQPIEGTASALLFKVREPFQGRHPFALLEGRQLPPRQLDLTAGMPDIDCYLDGAFRRLDLAYGAVARFSAAAEPLPVVDLP